jgi:hypothetical protein
MFVRGVLIEAFSICMNPFCPHSDAADLILGCRKQDTEKLSDSPKIMKIPPRSRTQTNPEGDKKKLSKTQALPEKFPSSKWKDAEGGESERRTAFVLKGLEGAAGL